MLAVLAPQLSAEIVKRIRTARPLPSAELGPASGLLLEES